MKEGKLMFNVKYVIAFFAIVGVSVVATIVGVLLLNFKDWVIDCIKERKWKKEYEHRFDKPPTAKCYCVDCWFYSKDNCKCDKFDKYVEDNWFCNSAQPLSYKDKEKLK